MLFEQTPVGQAPSRSAPSKTDSAETMWTGLLALIRALILGRRLPPDQLRMFLLFAPAVEGLTPKDVARLMGWRRDFDFGEDGDGFERDIPKDWTVGFEVNANEDGEHNYRAQLVTAAIIEALRKEHPEWEDDWSIMDNAYWEQSFFCYRVLNQNGRVSEIACWMEPRMELIRDRQFKVPKEIERRETLEFLAYAIDNMRHNAMYEVQWNKSSPPEVLACLHRVNSLKNVPLDDEAIAAWIYDNGAWECQDYYGPDTYIEAVDEACNALGYYGPGIVVHNPAKQQKKLFAA